MISVVNNYKIEFDIFEFTQLYRDYTYLNVSGYSAFIRVFKFIFTLKSICKFQDIYCLVFIDNIAVLLGSDNKFFVLFYKILVILVTVIPLSIVRMLDFEN